jgi:enamine deaminase RidA (YjgF/YER057c/UK114 family)
VRAGAFVLVSATAATAPDGSALHPGDVKAQTLESFRRALGAVEHFGGGVANVVRTRIYLADGADWRGAIEAHRELFAEAAPANSTLYVSGFIPAGVLVEVELDALLDAS